MDNCDRIRLKMAKRKKRAKIVFFTLLFALFILVLSILSMTIFFNAETIVVEGNSHYSATQIMEQGGLKIGQNLFRLDKFKVIEQMQELPYVKDVTIRRRLPSKLQITVEENRPVVWVTCSAGAALLNERYRVLEYVEYSPITAPVLPETDEEEKQPETADEDSHEEPEEEFQGEDAATELSGVPDKLKGIPQLILEGLTVPQVGQHVTFPENADYTGFLERLYTAFQGNADLAWDLVNEVNFRARYDIDVLYRDNVTVEFGTLDRADTKVQLAAYLLKDNGVSQAAVLDVTDVERVYYRPKTERTEPNQREPEAETETDT